MRSGKKGKADQTIGRRRRLSRFQRRFDAVASFLGDLLGHYEEEEADWRVLTLFSIITGALRTLAASVLDEKDRDVPWDRPFIEAQYQVELDWKALERGRRHITHTRLTEQDVEDHTRAVAKIAEAFISARDLFLLGELTHNVMVLRQGGRGVCVFPQSVLRAVRRLPRARARRILLGLREPFCIGTALLSDREVRSGRALSKRVAKRLRNVLASPQIRFAMWARRRRVAGSIVVVIAPLTVDLDKRHAFYPITIGVAFDDGRAPRFDRKTKRAFWRELIAELDDLVARSSIWDPSFLRTAELWKRDSPRGRRASRNLLALANGSTDFGSIGHREFEELVAELYAGLGYRVRLTRQSKDGGRDVIADHTGAIRSRTIIECKRQKPGKKVGILPVRALEGVADRERPNKAMLVSATGFTSDAASLIPGEDWRTELIDERHLRRLIRQYRDVVEVGERVPQRETQRATARGSGRRSRKRRTSLQRRRRRRAPGRWKI